MTVLRILFLVGNAYVAFTAAPMIAGISAFLCGYVLARLMNAP